MQKMRNELNMKKSSKSKGFTLIELLVVITIIGILAGLAVPAITGGLKRANQVRDVNNARQTGLTLFSDANDNSGVFRVDADGSGASPFGNATDLFKFLLDDGTLTTANVLAGTGVKASPNPTALAKANVAWAYVTPLKTSSNPNVPLLISYGPWTPAGIISKNGDAPGNATNSMWTDEGAVVYYVGGNAQFVKSEKSTGGAAGAKVVKFTPSDITNAGTLVILPP
jgi:prepilin-type N-terminal cleavage/methylation domain-containing protein